MASISKRTSRTKPYLVSYRDKEGRQHTRSFPLLKEAKTFAAKVEIKKPAGSNAAVPLQQAVDAFLEDRWATQSPATVRTHKTTLGQFVESVDVTRVSRVKPIHVERFRNRRRKSMSPKTVNNQMKQLSVFFNWCRRRGWIDENPASADVVEHPKFSRKTPPWLDGEEVDALLVDVRENCTDPQIALAIILAVRAGLRLGEICALRWDGVRYADGIIDVNVGKSKEPRRVPMHRDVREALGSTPQVNDYVFPPMRATNRGEHLESNSFGVRCRNWLHGHGHPKVGMHTLRHSFASAMARHGASEEDLRELLGHVSAATTKMYIHSWIDHRQALIDRLGTDPGEGRLIAMEGWLP